LPFALKKTESPKLYSVISVPFCPFQPHVSPSQAHFSTSTSVPTINGKVQYCPFEPQEQKEESWDRVDRMWKACAYLWLTDWRLTGLASGSEIQCACGCGQWFGLFNWCFAFGCHHIFSILCEKVKVRKRRRAH